MLNPVQTKVGSWSSGTTAATSFNSLPAASGAVFAWVRIYIGGGTGTVNAIADNQTGNAFVKIAQIADTNGNGDIELWWCSGISAPSGTYTVTATLSGSFNARLDLIEGVSGLSLDQYGTNAPASGSTSGSVSASASNTAATDFVMAGIEVQYNPGSSVSGPSTGYTTWVNDTGFVSYVDTNLAYKTESAMVTSSATAWTWMNSLNYAAIIATFKSGSAPPSTQQQLTMMGVGS